MKMKLLIFGIIEYLYIFLKNLNSVTYSSLYHIHLLVSHESVTNNQIIHKHQTEKNFCSSYPQFASTEIPKKEDFSNISCVINCNYFLESSCNWKCTQCSTKNFQTSNKVYSVL